jgi:hypothetical protein
MKKGMPKDKAARRRWVRSQADKLRQECNRLTEEERRAANEHALSLIYGTHASVPSRRG